MQEYEHVSAGTTKIITNFVLIPSINIQLVKDIKIFLKKQKTENENMVVNENVSEDKKQRLFEYRKRYH